MEKRGIVGFLSKSDSKGSANDSAIKRPKPYIGLARPFLPDSGPSLHLSSLGHKSRLHPTLMSSVMSSPYCSSLFSIVLIMISLMTHTSTHRTGTICHNFPYLLGHLSHDPHVLYCSLIFPVSRPAWSPICQAPHPLCHLFLLTHPSHDVAILLFSILTRHRCISKPTKHDSERVDTVTRSQSQLWQYIGRLWLAE